MNAVRLTERDNLFNPGAKHGIGDISRDVHYNLQQVSPRCNLTHASLNNERGPQAGRPSLCKEYQHHTTWKAPRSSCAIVAGGLWIFTRKGPGSVGGRKPPARGWLYTLVSL